MKHIVAFDLDGIGADGESVTDSAKMEITEQGVDIFWGSGGVSLMPVETENVTDDNVEKFAKELLESLVLPTINIRERGIITC